MWDMWLFCLHPTIWVWHCFFKCYCCCFNCTSSFWRYSTDKTGKLQIKVYGLLLWCIYFYFTSMHNFLWVSLLIWYHGMMVKVLSLPGAIHVLLIRFIFLQWQFTKDISKLGSSTSLKKFMEYRNLSYVHL